MINRPRKCPFVRGSGMWNVFEPVSPDLSAARTHTHDVPAPISQFECRCASASINVLADSCPFGGARTFGPAVEPAGQVLFFAASALHPILFETDSQSDEAPIWGLSRGEFKHHLRRWRRLFEVAVAFSDAELTGIRQCSTTL